MFKKVLIANRGEIAIRIIRACKELGIATVAIYSEADRDSLHVRMADEAICIGPAPNRDSYLNMPNIISAAIITGAEAIHPGYAYFSEQASFAEACEACNLKFIGPKASAIELMGDKSRAKETAAKAGVPVIPGSPGTIENEQKAFKVAARIGYPIRLKATAGGGGRGIRVVNGEEELASALRTAQAEAEAAFGNGLLYIEKEIVEPRHIEIQLMGDEHGNYIHLGERECSIQRRHQKLIEEAPSCAVTPAIRKRMGEAAIKLAKAVGYSNAGTVEFLLDSRGDFYFMEMNTRVQVEHPVTELVTGLDIVREQILVASGERAERFAERHQDQRPCHRVQDHSRGSREQLRAVGRHYPASGRPGWDGRSPGHSHLRRLSDPSVLRRHARQAGRMGREPQGRHRAHDALPVRI